MAKTRFSAVRNTATLPCGVFTQRAPRSGMSEMSPISTQFMSISSLGRLGKTDRRHWPEFVLVLAGDTLRPRIDLCEFLAEDEALVVSLALFVIPHDLAADLVQTDALRPFVDAF